MRSIKKNKKISNKHKRNYSRKIAAEMLYSLEDFLAFVQSEGDLSPFYLNKDLDWLIKSIEYLKSYIKWLDDGGAFINPNGEEKHLQNLQKIFTKSFNKLIKI